MTRKFLLAASVVAFAALAALPGTALAGSRTSGCEANVKLTHWTQAVEAFFGGGKTSLEINGIAGKYNSDFLDFLVKDKSWGLADNGKYIGKLLVPGEGQVWKITNSAAPITAPTVYNEDGTTLGRIWKKYLQNGVGVLGAYDQNRFPPGNWVEIDGKAYIILDKAAEHDNNLLVSLEPGIYSGPDVSYVTVCFIPAP